MGLFIQATGMKINIHKSSIYSQAIVENEITSIEDILAAPLKNIS